MSHGTSPKPLYQKLGLKEAMKVHFIDPPPEYGEWMNGMLHRVDQESKPPWEFVHLFVNTTHGLETSLLKLRKQIAPAGMIWVSWYKKSANLPTEITEDIIRDTALALGLVDIKVCSVSEEWSALKLVIRKELRNT